MDGARGAEDERESEGSSECEEEGMGWESWGDWHCACAWVKPMCVNVTWKDGSSVREEGRDCDALNRKKTLRKDACRL